MAVELQVKITLTLLLLHPEVVVSPKGALGAGCGGLELGTALGDGDGLGFKLAEGDGLGLGEGEGDRLSDGDGSGLGEGKGEGIVGPISCCWGCCCTDCCRCCWAPATCPAWADWLRLLKIPGEGEGKLTAEGSSLK